MPNPDWLDEVRRAVVRRGLPAEYADRLAEELGDHADELGRAGETAARLGDPSAVADAAVAGYRAGRFAGRHPVAAFVVVPTVLSFLAWCLFTVFGDGVLEAVAAAAGDPASPAVFWAAGAVVWAAGVLVPAAVVGVVGRDYRRSGRPRAWYYAATAAVAVVAALLVTDLGPPSDLTAVSIVVEWDVTGFGPAHAARAGFVAAFAVVVLALSSPRRCPTARVALA